MTSNATNPKPAASAHTPEPWHVVNGHDGTHIEAEPFRIGSTFQPVTVAKVDYGSVHTYPANAARIVACVNACHGIDPAAVPLMLEALQYALAWIDKHKLAEPLASIAGGFMEHPMRHCIRAAIAKAKGGAK